MKELGYIFAKIKSKLCHQNKEVVSDYFRKAGMKIGNNCNVCCNIMTKEPYLIEIGDNVTISGSVTFVTHDNSVSKFFGDGKDLYGKISIGANSFVGQGVMLMYGVPIPCNTIIGAGSVVVESVEEEGCIIAGNPARIIGSTKKFSEKIKKNVIMTKGFLENERKKTVLENEDLLISRNFMKSKH